MTFARLKVNLWRTEGPGYMVLQSTGHLEFGFSCMVFRFECRWVHTSLPLHVGGPFNKPINNKSLFPTWQMAMEPKLGAVIHGSRRVIPSDPVVDQLLKATATMRLWWCGQIEGSEVRLQIGPLYAARRTPCRLRPGPQFDSVGG